MPNVRHGASKRAPAPDDVCGAEERSSLRAVPSSWRPGEVEASGLSLAANPACSERKQHSVNSARLDQDLLFLQVPSSDPPQLASCLSTSSCTH